MRDLRMLLFHARLFRHNSYFFQLLLTSTLGMVAMQALAARLPGATLADLGWLRAGMFGTWTMCAVAVGMLGYQSFQGTLVHLYRTPVAAFRTLMPVVGAASVFGLAALPLAALFAWLLRMPVSLPHLGGLLVAGLLFGLACLAVSALAGMAFVLNRNALAYEGLAATPLVLLSGVFGTPPFLPPLVLALARVLPTRAAVDLLTEVAAGGTLSLAPIVEIIGVSAVWLAAACWLGGFVTRRAAASAKLGVI